jgi:uncharacterized protein YifE (UPF0438 family)
MELLNNIENLLYQSNLRLIKALKYSLEKLEDNIELEKNYISFCTLIIRENNNNEFAETKVSAIVERDKRRKTLSKLKRELKKLKKLTQTDI